MTLFASVFTPKSINFAGLKVNEESYENMSNVKSMEQCSTDRIKPSMSKNIPVLGQNSNFGDQIRTFRKKVIT